MAMSAPADFCTIAWAAELAGVTQRTIYRAMTGDNPALTRVQPLVGSRESGRRHTLLYVSQVRQYAEARRLLKPDGQESPYLTSVSR